MSNTAKNPRIDLLLLKKVSRLEAQQHQKAASSPLKSQNKRLSFLKKVKIWWHKLCRKLKLC